MTKRAGQTPNQQAQADLFGVAPQQAAPKKTRTGQRAHSAFAKPTSLSAAPRTEKGAVLVVSGGLLNVRQAAARLGLSKSTLDKMRCAGKGPRFVKSTDRAVRYDPTDLDAWIDARRRSRTSET